MMRFSYQLEWLRLVLGGRARDVAAEYRSLAARKNLLADIAMRGGVFDPAPAPDHPQKLAWHEGRRSLALEILHLSRADAMDIEAFVKTAIRTQTPKEPRHG